MVAIFLQRARIPSAAVGGSGAGWGSDSVHYVPIIEPAFGNSDQAALGAVALCAKTRCSKVRAFSNELKSRIIVLSSG
jgi:hypothetical protein